MRVVLTRRAAKDLDGLPPRLQDTVRKQLKRVVPRGGVEPPTHGFSVPLNASIRRVFMGVCRSLVAVRPNRRARVLLANSATPLAQAGGARDLGRSSIRRG